MEKEELEVFNIFDYDWCFPGIHKYVPLKKINFYGNFNESSRVKSKLILICKCCGKIKIVKM